MKIQDGYKRLHQAPKMAMKSWTHYSCFYYSAALCVNSEYNVKKYYKINKMF